MCASFSIVETEKLWNTFDEDRKSLDDELTTVERDLSRFKVKEITFQQMKSMLPQLKVILHVVQSILML